MAKQITKITPEELKAAQESLQSSKSETFVSVPHEETDYIAKLKDSDIIEYFKPFGFQHLTRFTKEKDDFSALQVTCDDFFLALSNFDVFVDIYKTQNLTNPNSVFNMMAFLEYCGNTDISPEKALGELFQIELLGQRFHSYEKAYKKHKQAERKEAFEKLPKDMQKKLGIINDKREHEINAIQNKLKYGDFEGEPKTNI